MKKTGNLIIFAVCALLAAMPSVADSNQAFRGQLAGSQVGEHVAGVPSGGAPWVITASEFHVSGSGRTEVEIRGLVISAGPLINTAGPVTMVAASLVCNDVVSGTTGAVPLSSGGDASIHDSITLPASCIEPALLIRIAATTSAGPISNGPFIAVNALMAGARHDAGGDRDHD